MKLSDQLKAARADRPDEWTMDRFINMADKLEQTVEYIENTYWEDPEDAIGDIRKFLKRGGR